MFSLSPSNVVYNNSSEATTILTEGDDDNPSDFLEFRQQGAFDLAFVPEPRYRKDELLFKPGTVDFGEWLKTNQPDLNIEMRKADGHLFFKSAADIWLPLVFLAADVTLQFYLNLVASYISDRARRLFAGEQLRVHLDVEYIEEGDKKVKRLHFEGTEDALQNLIDKVDVNKLMD